MTEKAIVVPLVRGLGQDLDSRIAPGGVLEIALNAKPTKVGRLARRDGYDRGPITGYSNGESVSLQNTDHVWEHDGANGVRHEVIGAGPRRYAATTPYALTRPSARQALFARVSDATYEAVEGGKYLAVAGTSDRTYLGDAASLGDYAGMASHDGYDLVVSAKTGTGWTAVVYDAETQREIFRYTSADSAAQYVKVWHWPGTNRLCIGWVSSSTHRINYRYVNTVSPRAIQSATTLGNMTVATSTESGSVTYPHQPWDVIGLGGSTGYPTSVAVAAKTDDYLWVEIINDSASVTAVTMTTVNERMACLATHGDALYVLGGAAPVDAYLGQLDLTYIDLTDSPLAPNAETFGDWETMPVLASVGMFLQFGATTPSAIVAITTAAEPSDSLDATRFWVWDSSTSSFRTAHVEYGARLASEIFCDELMPLVWLGYNLSTSYQRGRYLMSVPFWGYAGATGGERSILARVGFGAAWDSERRPLHRPGQSSYDSRFGILFQEISQGDFAAPSASQLGLYRYDTDVTTFERLQVASLAGSNLGGGMLLHYDGRRVCEQGWLQYPESANHSVTAGTGFPAGTYYYQVCFEETDALGNLHQSAPSPVHTATIAAECDAVNVLAYAPMRTMRTSNLKVAAYRTTADGTVFRRVGDVAVSADGAVATVVDTVLDADLEAREALRASAGELEEAAPDGGCAIAAHANRVWAASGDELWYTKEYVPGFAHGWSLANVVNCPAPVRAIASTGESLLILGEHDAWQLWGEGPDRLGQGSYGPPQWLAAVGCPKALGGARACARTMAGVIWRTRSGISLLPRGAAEPRIISGPVEDTLASYPIVAAIVDEPSQECVHIHLVASEAMNAASVQVVYWYGLAEPMWTQWSNVCTGIHSAAIVSGVHVYASAYYPTIGVYSQTAGTVVDDVGATSYSVQLTLTTRPLFPFGVGTEGRVRRIGFEGYSSASSSLAAVCTVDTTACASRSVSLSAGADFSVELAPQVHRGVSWKLSWPEASGSAGSASGVELATVVLYCEQSAIRAPHRSTQRF